MLFFIMNGGHSSATSLNFIGFDELQGNGTSPLLYNRIVILPHRAETAGKWVHPVAGPARAAAIQPRVQVYNKSAEAADKRLARQGFKRVYSGFR